MEEKKKRQQLANVLQICISPARVQNHLRPQMLSPDAYTQLVQLRKFPSNEAVVKKKISDLLETRLRTSSATPIALTVGIEVALGACISDLFETALTREQKTVTVQLFQEFDISQREWYALFRTTFIDQEMPSEYNISTTFDTYIDELIKSVKERYKGRFNALRITAQVKAFLNKMVIQFIARVARIAKTVIYSVQQGKTLTPKHIINIFAILLSEFGNTVFKEVLWDSINEKVAIFLSQKSLAPM